MESSAFYFLRQTWDCVWAPKSVLPLGERAAAAAGLCTQFILWEKGTVTSGCLGPSMLQGEVASFSMVTVFNRSQILLDKNDCLVRLRVPTLLLHRTDLEKAKALFKDFPMINHYLNNNKKIAPMSHVLLLQKAFLLTVCFLGAP